MATRALFPAGVFSVGGEMMEDEGPGLSELPGNNLPVPQLVMLANAATAVGGAESATAAEEGAGGGGGDDDDDGPVEEKEMVELKTVGCSYSDSEGESVRYSYDHQNRVEFCIVEYVDSPGPPAWAPAPGNKAKDDHEEEEEEEEEEDAAKDLSKASKLRAPDALPKAPAVAAAAKRNVSHATVVESAKKKKPFHCKPCNYQAENEEEFVEHLGTHAVSKRMVVNRVEGRSKAKAMEAGGLQQESEAGGTEGDAGDSKGVIRCERCGYNTNRYDHYVAHLKHHSKEGEDHRVFKCTLCPYTTVSQYHWRKHLRNHFPSKLHTCDQCSYFSDRKSNYIQHIRTHTGVRPFRCPYCDYSSSQKTHLTRHMRTHSGERPFKCDSCNYLAANQHEVTRHARQVHNGPKPLACPYCQYKTADRSNFKKHVELHLNPRQFHCPLCKYAASKKCNLQYHIKSRHLGCDIPIDVSKVKLRVKKGSEDPADPVGRSKSNKTRSADAEDDDYESGDDEEYVSKQAPAPISLSAKRSGRHAQVAENEVETDRVQRKAKATAADKDKGALEGKEKVVRKVRTRQKKVAGVSESTMGKSAVETPAVPVKSRDAKVKRSSKKKKQLLEEEKSSIPDGLEETDGRDEPANLNGEQVALQRSMEEMKKLQKEKKAKKLEKVRKAKQEKDEQKASAQVNKRLQSRRTGARKSDKASEKPAEAVSMETCGGPEEVPEVDKQVWKARAGKRKAIEALDLSTKHSSAETSAVGIHPNPKKCKISAAVKPATKPSTSKVVSETTGPPSAPEKDLQKKETAPSPVKLKKTRKTNKKTPVHQDSPVSTKDKQDSAAGETSTPPRRVKSCSTKLQTAVTQPTQLTRSTADTDTNPEESQAEPQLTQPDDNKAAPQEAAPSAPETISVEDVSVGAEAPSASCGSGKEATPSPVTDRPAAPPTFRRPDAKTPRPSLELPRHGEEDEGIHSSHEGASDVSDSASEGGSEDSGLNSAGAGSGKMPNDPETPTDEIPTPTELKSHLCVFCDRTFPLEVEYRRHVNRHLVNVYYMDSPTAKGGK
ncbi:unnamed protein product [Merluccius merluccius]